MKGCCAMINKIIKGGCGFEDVIELNDIQITNTAKKALTESEVYIALFRHTYHDWGLAPDELWSLNEANFLKRNRVASCFESSSGVLFTVSTDFGEKNKTVVALVSEIE